VVTGGPDDQGVGLRRLGERERQAERAHPKNPAFLLKDGELAELLAPLSILRSRQGEFEGRFVASIVAERAK
jgi:hypothetical protein